MDIVQIVPHLPPEFCGVGDYAWLLANSMRDQGVKTHFIVTDPTRRGESEINGVPIEVLPACTEQALHDALGRLGLSHVLLHYVGYAYDMYGCPQWVLNALKDWREEDNQRYLTTMFHELYASGAPWTRAFWSSNRQRRIAAGLAQTSDSCRTNMTYIARRIGDLAPRHKSQVTAIPVFSTVGEPTTVRPLAARQRRIVVFGTKGWRAQIYTKYRQELLQVCEQLHCESVVDIGHPLDLEVELPVSFVRAGALPSQEVSDIMSDSMVGLLSYSPRFFGKSTIFASYCAHGLLPVIVGPKQDNEDGLMANTHFWRPDSMAEMDLPTAQKIADAAHNWYLEHRLDRQAEELKNGLSPQTLKAY